MTKSQGFLDRCLLIDIEVNEKNVVYSLGATLGKESFQSVTGKPVNTQTLEQLDIFGQDADFILGHNIIIHDLPYLQKIKQSIEVFSKPVIDTLFLSPLAYPANPYHRLVKDYQIVRDSVNNPVKDAILAGKVFLEQWSVFVEQTDAKRDAPVFYRSFLQKDSTLTGTAEALGAMGIPLLTGDDLHESFSWFAKKYCCTTAVDELVEKLYDETFPHPVLAYITAWLTVAGGNSVLPPWVRHHFPHISSILHGLRENQCNDSRCEYCQSNHNPQVFLQKYFGFQDFRAHPATEEGLSLQGEVVSAAAKNRTIFATLPTGGGKSLCYQLPGLMRYLRRNMLTIVISPLQALMKDQVDNFSKQTGTKLATALYGMLTLPERGEVLESIRLGDVGVLYVSPEQLRNNSFLKIISQREIGAWVFDEAHCLSKWGHDFRPDYFYAIRFIREFAQKEKTQIPPVQCFTATAKKDVKAEIIDTIQSELGLRVNSFEGGHERSNLHYEVYPVDRYEKFQVILELLRARYSNSGSVVIYCATKKNTENLAEFLQNNGYNADAFHAGLQASLKKRIQESFISGDLPIICATNAFGMGIDKDDVRLVIHADIPGSLENYLQEAGRAGRDRDDAECILVFDEHDIEGQFRLSSSSRLTRRDIAQILGGIRSASKGGEEVVLTPGELLKQDVVDIDSDDFFDPDTKIRTAVAWLERAGFLKRNENNTRVFQGKPLVRDLHEAAEKIGKLDLSSRQRDRWLAIVKALIEKGDKDGFSTDELASLSSFSTTEEDGKYLTETHRVLTTLQDMADQGILSKETTLTAYIRYKVSNNAVLQLQRLCQLEKDFLKILEALAPDADIESPLELDLRQINQQLVDLDHGESTTVVLNNILHGLSRDGKGLAGQKGSLSLKTRGNNQLTVYLHRGWGDLVKTVTIRQQASNVALKVLHTTIPTDSKPNGSLLVEFTLEQIVDGLKNDLLLLPQLKNPLAAAERALTFMHEQGVVDLQHGLAVFRQAMTLSLQSESKGRRYAVADFSPLNTHYTERNFQIHVMNEYARQALDKLSTAMRLVSSYFNDEKDEFVKRYFPGKKKMLEVATSEQSYQRIVDDLRNKKQAAIVSAPVEKNMLVLAGPGSGKTRVVVHRVAYLLRVKRVKACSILVLCFNRSATMELRKRLRELVGDEMRWVTTLTFHGLALRLVGRSLVASKDKTGKQHDIDFSQIIKDAINLLQGNTDVLGYGEGVREELVGKFSHILVDEYQDIDAEQYELISLLSGKSLEDHDQKMSILAVGDDDQNIYRFRGANVGFIRQFQSDYNADIHYLVENYRSTGNIISACNILIDHNQDRMKTDRAIQVNDARKMLPRGGNWQINDPLVRGKVQVLQVKDEVQQSIALREEIKRLQSLEGGFDVNNCAVLAREWKDLDVIRSVFEESSIPINFNWGRGGGFPSLTRLRENVLLLEYLKKSRTQSMTGSSLLEFLPDRQADDNIWQENLRSLLTDWIGETHDTEQAVPAIEEYLYEALADQGRSKNLGNGVFLSTVHSVKGLEFDHVFILDGSWAQKRGDEAEEERRLFYVAMSRARETLSLFSMSNAKNPHNLMVNGEFVQTRSVDSFGGVPLSVYKYALLGMDDLFIDFAGMKKEEHSSRKAISGLKVGEDIWFKCTDKAIELVNKVGIPVGRLSKSAKNKWSKSLMEVEKAKVVVIVRRYKEDNSDEAQQERCFGEKWEVPLVELKTNSLDRCTTSPVIIKDDNKSTIGVKVHRDFNDP
ncbi:MAG: RecQ family ATP-dependent DNA helicase [Desulfobulbaceae bacterium]|nr:RecQ family ATP-dependent DNA helicase [Desulfobulbaceae bacterium]